jgi:hypothetical protein
VFFIVSAAGAGTTILPVARTGQAGALAALVNSANAVVAGIIADRQ